MSEDREAPLTSDSASAEHFEVAADFYVILLSDIIVSTGLRNQFGVAVDGARSIQARG